MIQTRSPNPALWVKWPCECLRNIFSRKCSCHAQQTVTLFFFLNEFIFPLRRTEMTSLSWLRNLFGSVFWGVLPHSLFICDHAESDVCVWLDVALGHLFSPSVCLLHESFHEIFKVQCKLICWPEVCFLPQPPPPPPHPSSPPLSDQIPMELHPRRTVISHISGMTKFRAGTTAASHSAGAQINGILLSGEGTMDHTHTLIRPSDWISHGRLDH